jgi:hypothetical protein
MLNNNYYANVRRDRLRNRNVYIFVCPARPIRALRRWIWRTIVELVTALVLGIFRVLVGALVVFLVVEYFRNKWDIGDIYELKDKLGEVIDDLSFSYRAVSKSFRFLSRLLSWGRW